MAYNKLDKKIVSDFQKAGGRKAYLKNMVKGAIGKAKHIGKSAGVNAKSLVYSQLSKHYINKMGKQADSLRKNNRAMDDVRAREKSGLSHDEKGRPLHAFKSFLKEDFSKTAGKVEKTRKKSEKMRKRFGH